MFNIVNKCLKKYLLFTKYFFRVDRYLMKNSMSAEMLFNVIDK